MGRVGRAADRRDVGGLRCCSDLYSLLGEMEVDALVEVHTEREAERALMIPARILGVNNRDLSTFETDRGTTARIGALAHERMITLVAESGIHSRDHVLEVEQGRRRPRSWSERRCS